MGKTQSISAWRKFAKLQEGCVRLGQSSDYPGDKKHGKNRKIRKIMFCIDNKEVKTVFEENDSRCKYEVNKWRMLWRIVYFLFPRIVYFVVSDKCKFILVLSCNSF